MTTIDTESRVYVGTYAKYNNGSIRGEWMDLADYSGKSEFLEACAELHSDESDPELMFQDWEGIPEGMISESHISESVFEWLDLSDTDRKLIAVYREAVGARYDDIASELHAANMAYHGTYDSVADFAEDFATQTESVPAEIANWIVIDWEASWNCNLCRDFPAEYYEGEYWIFSR